MRRASLFPFLFLFAAGGVVAQPLLQTTTAVDYDDNWNYASRSGEKKSDIAGSLQVNAGWRFVLPADDMFSLGATARTQYFDRYGDLDNTGWGAVATYSHKLGIGAEVPRVWLTLAAERAHYHDTVRSGWSHNVTVGIDKWFGERWQLQATGNYFRRNGGAGEEEEDAEDFSTEVFDQQAWTLGLSATCLLSDATAVIFGYARRDGDITATTRPVRGIYRVSDAIAEDEVFGEEYYAYRLQAVAQDFYIEVSEGLDTHNSVNLRYQHRIAEGRGGFDYENNIARLSWIYAY